MYGSDLDEVTGVVHVKHAVSIPEEERLQRTAGELAEPVLAVPSSLRLDPLLGMSTWYASHLDHQLPILTAAAGPFAECDPTRHCPPETDRLAPTSAPADWWPPSRG